MKEEVKKKVVMLLVGLFLGLDNESCGSSEHLGENISYREIKDVLSELGETDLLAKIEEYWNRDNNELDEEKADELYSELRKVSHPNGRWEKRW